MERPDWNTYFLSIANAIKQRSTCSRRQVGAVIVKDHHILATGYNGAPAGILHCFEKGCLREALQVPSGERHELCRGIHAEQNAIIQAARYGGSTIGATLYCNTQPCSICAKMIINAGIEKVVFSGGYSDPLSIEILKEAGVELMNIKDLEAKLEEA